MSSPAGRQEGGPAKGSVPVDAAVLFLLAFGLIVIGLIALPCAFPAEALDGRGSTPREHPISRRLRRAWRSNATSDFVDELERLPSSPVKQPLIALASELFGLRVSLTSLRRADPSLIAGFESEDESPEQRLEEGVAYLRAQADRLATLADLQRETPELHDILERTAHDVRTVQHAIHTAHNELTNAYAAALHGELSRDQIKQMVRYFQKVGTTISELRWMQSERSV
jgi:hypothetical protein